VTRLRANDGSNQGTFAVGSNPLGMVFDGAHIWVANSGDDTVTRLTREGAVDGSVTVPTAPFFMAFDGYNIWVTHYTNPGKVSRFRAEDGASLKEYTIGQYPFGVVFDGANVWVSISYDHYVTKF
jgi:DNA-binding beta-propeller fold protein YncE